MPQRFVVRVYTGRLNIQLSYVKDFDLAETGVVRRISAADFICLENICESKSSLLSSPHARERKYCFN